MTAACWRMCSGQGNSRGNKQGEGERRRHPGVGWGATIPEPDRRCRSSGSGIAQDASGQQGGFGQPLAGLRFVDELAGCSDHLLGREGELFDRPAIAVEIPCRLRRQRQRCGQQERVVIPRVEDDDDRKAGGVGRSVRQHQGDPLFGADRDAAFLPGNDLIRCGGGELALPSASRSGRTSSPWIGGRPRPW